MGRKIVIPNLFSVKMHYCMYTVLNVSTGYSGMGFGKSLCVSLSLYFKLFKFRLSCTYYVKINNFSSYQ